MFTNAKRRRPEGCRPLHAFYGIRAGSFFLVRISDRSAREDLNEYGAKRLEIFAERTEKADPCFFVLTVSEIYRILWKKTIKNYKESG